MSMTKHRAESDLFSIDFASKLNEGEILSTVVTLRVEHAPLDVWNDVTEDVLVTDSVVIAESGSAIHFNLGPAADDTKQPAGVYRVYSVLGTSASRIIVGIADLDVTG